MFRIVFFCSQIVASAHCHDYAKGDAVPAEYYVVKPRTGLKVNQVKAPKRQTGAVIRDMLSADDLGLRLRNVSLHFRGFVSSEQKPYLSRANKYQQAREPLQPKVVVRRPFFRRAWVNVGLGLFAGALYCGLLWWRFGTGKV